MVRGSTSNSNRHIKKLEVFVPSPGRAGTEYRRAVHVALVQAFPGAEISVSATGDRDEVVL